MNEETKYCKFCGKEKPIKYFVKSGFCVKNICKDCNNKKQKEVYKNSKNYHKLQQENQQLKEKYNKALEILTEYNLPYEIDKFNTKEENLDYCSKNCSVDEEIFIKCWDRFIEQEIEGSNK